jgi:hypothetical protein
LARLDQADGEYGAATSCAATDLAKKIAILKECRGRYDELSQDLERTGESQLSLAGR